MWPYIYVYITTLYIQSKIAIHLQMLCEINPHACINSDCRIAPKVTAASMQQQFRNLISGIRFLYIYIFCICTYIYIRRYFRVESQPWTFQKVHLTTNECNVQPTQLSYLLRAHGIWLKWSHKVSLLYAPSFTVITTIIKILI